MKYQQKPLGDICNFNYGDGLKETDRTGGSIPVYGSNGIVGYHNKPLTLGKTIIIGRKGSIGEIHYSYVPCWPIDTTYYVDRTKMPCDFTWLFYILTSLDLTRLNKSAAIPGLNREDAYQQMIPFPPLPEQQRIAAILQKADRLRRLRQYACQLSDVYLQSVFLEMFGDPETNPRKWNRATISDLGRVQTGNTPSRNNREYYGDFIEWIKSDNILADDLFPIKSKEYLSKQGLRVGRSVESGSVLLTCIAGSVSSIGNVGIVNRKMAFNQQINAITPNKDIDIFFLYSLIKASKRLIQNHATGGMKHLLTKSNLESIVLYKPPKDLQLEFKKILLEHYKLVEEQKESVRQVEFLFQSLLQRAFQGML